MKLVTTRTKARGTAYSFTCPGCGRHHAIYVDGLNGPSWTFNGDMEKPTFSPSILDRIKTKDGGERSRCHFFIRAGRIEFCGDSEHALAGKTVDLPDIIDQD